MHFRRRSLQWHRLYHLVQHSKLVARVLVLLVHTICDTWTVFASGCRVDLCRTYLWPVTQFDLQTLSIPHSLSYYWSFHDLRILLCELLHIEHDFTSEWPWDVRHHKFADVRHRKRPLHLLQYQPARQASLHPLFLLHRWNGRSGRLLLCRPGFVLYDTHMVELVLYIHLAGDYIWRQDYWGDQHLLLLSTLLQKEDHQVQWATIHYLCWHDSRSHCFCPCA